MAPPIVHDVLRSSGHPLDAQSQSFFERRFGHDFSRVRVHDDFEAAESARAVNALAYTVGSQIVFGAGSYRPDAASGRRLLAHELTHVVQQDSAVPSRGPIRVGPAQDAHEHEADRAAAAVVGKRAIVSADPVHPRKRRAMEERLGDSQGASTSEESRGSIHSKDVNAQDDVRLHQSESEVKQPFAQSGARRSGLRLLSRSSGDAILRRKCLEQIGATPPGCKLVPAESVDPSGGEKFLFNVNCDDFAPGEKERLEKFADPKNISSDQEITVVGMASADGPKDFNDSLSCHRATAAVDILTAKGLGKNIKTVQAVGGVRGTQHDPTFRAVLIKPKCIEGPVNQDKDPLPSVPPFTFSVLPAEQVMEKVKQMQPPGHPLPKNPPLGASQPTFEQVPVKVSSVPIPDSGCVKCVAEWDLTAKWQSLISSGPIDSDEPKRFAVFRENDASGCPPRALPVLLPVKRIVTQAAIPVIIAGEREHYNDFVRAFQMVGGRYLSNVRRLTPERTHLRARHESECADKVSDFLFDARGHYFHFFPPFLERYTRTFARDFTIQYNLPDRDRPGGPHEANPTPPTRPTFQKPIFPNIDLDVNPFGCKAFFRKYDARCAPGIPGPTSESIIKETNEPLKQPWHEL